MDFFEKRGLKSIIREDNKVFPSSFKAMDVLKVLIGSVKDAKMLLNSGVEKVSYDESKKYFMLRQVLPTMQVIA